MRERLLAWRSAGARPIVVALAAGALLASPLVARDENVEYETAARTILCDCGCHPQSVYDCACGRAAAMRTEILEQARGGATSEQIVATWVERVGEQIRIAPTATGFNLVAWLGPGLALLAAGTAMILLLRRWRRLQPAETPSSSAPEVSPDDVGYLARLEAELKEYDP